MTERRQSMLDLKACAALVEGVPARNLLGLACESIRGLTAVVSEQLADLHRRGLVQTPQEIATSSFTLIDRAIWKLRGAAGKDKGSVALAGMALAQAVAGRSVAAKSLNERAGRGSIAWVLTDIQLSFQVKPSHGS